MVSARRLQNVAATVIVAGLVTTGRAHAQTKAPVFPKQNFETRAELEARAKASDAAKQKAESYRLHYRLDYGDFRDGDRIFVTFQQGAAVFADTLTVHAEKRLELSNMGDVALEGVLRSELVPRLTAHLKTYLRDPVVKATPLVRLGLLGNVARPGYYYTAADLPLNDVLMRAGGPTPNADLGRVSVRRLGDVVIDENNTQTAFREGMSVDMLSLQGGDEIQVGEKRRTNWALIMPIASTAVGLLIAFTQRH